MELSANLSVKPEISGTMTLPVSELTRVEALDLFLAENSYALLDVPCDQIPIWESLAEYTPPPSVMNRLEYLQDNRRNFWETYIEGADWQVQQLSEANGTKVNMDYFSVTVSTLPGGMSAQDLFEHIRANMPTTDSTTFLNEEIAALEVYPDLPDEEELWLSDNPLSSILSFQITDPVLGFNVNDGSVITSDYETGSPASHWTFTTIKTPEDWRHPVTGNRKFGFKVNPNGTYTFYTRGVDRVTSWLDTGIQLSLNAMGKLIGREGLDLAFNTADDLWASYLDRMVAYIEANGGSATSNGSTTYWPQWDKVEGFLSRKKDLAVLVGCSN